MAPNTFRVKNTFLEYACHDSQSDSGEDNKIYVSSDATRRESSAPPPAIRKLLEFEDGATEEPQSEWARISPRRSYLQKSYSKQKYSSSDSSGNDQDEDKDYYSSQSSGVTSTAPWARWTSQDTGDMDRQETVDSMDRQETVDSMPCFHGAASASQDTMDSMDSQEVFLAVPRCKTKEFAHRAAASARKGQGASPPGAAASSTQMPSQVPAKKRTSGVDVTQLAVAAKAAATGGFPSKDLAWSNTFTVMMRNFPNKFTKDILLSAIDDAGFNGSYDFVYVPIDPNTAANRGYAFINFLTPSLAFTFKKHFDGFKFTSLGVAHKVVSVVPAAVQGFNANFANYSKAASTRQLDPAVQPLFLREPKLSKQRPRNRHRAESLIDIAAKQQIQQPEPPEVQAPRVLTPGKGTRASTPGKGSKGHDNSKGQDGSERVRSLTPGKGTKGYQSSNAKAAGPAVATTDTSKTLGSFCPYCGGRTAPNFKFCHYCGAAVPSTSS